MSDKWEFYFTTINDAAASVFVDIGVRETVPDVARPWLLWTSIRFQQPRDDGLSSSVEAQTLFAIEDTLIAAVSKRTQGDHVGRITTAGKRDFYFYAPTRSGFERAIDEVRASFPSYRFDSGTRDDSDWSQYLEVLYPSPEDFQRILNLHVIESLQQHGDPLTKSRLVFHWAYFPNEYHRSEFVASATQCGYRVSEEWHHADAELPFGVRLERCDHVDWNAINQVTLFLFQLARDANGEYDGWETSVEKAN